MGLRLLEVYHALDNEERVREADHAQVSFRAPPTCCSEYLVLIACQHVLDYTVVSLRYCHVLLWENV